MADTAARLVEEVLPLVPVRQFVLSFSYEIRYRLAWDGALVSSVLDVFLRVVQGWYRRQARAQGYQDGRCGSVTFVQRVGLSINLNPHFHVLLLDGVYVRGEDGAPFFVPAPPLTDDDVRDIVGTTAKRVIRLCLRRGLFEKGSTDPLWEQEPLLAQISAASVQGMVATGIVPVATGRRASPTPKMACAPGRCVMSHGGSQSAACPRRMHAARIEATDRRWLERLCRYVIRPPVASGRLGFVDEETLVFSLKTHWADGTCKFLLSPQELLEKLAALVPPPRPSLERDINLKTALLFGELCRAAGAEVIQLREDIDGVLYLARRDSVRNSGADVFVSIHTNAAGGGFLRIKGTRAFYHDPFWAPLATDIYNEILGLYLQRNTGSWIERIWRRGFLQLPAHEESLASEADRRAIADKVLTGLLTWLAEQPTDVAAEQTETAPEVVGALEPAP